MAHKLDHAELVSFRELLLANSIMSDAPAKILSGMGLITYEKFFTKLKLFQAVHEASQND